MSFTDFSRKNDEFKVTIQVDRETAIRNDLEYMRSTKYDTSNKEQFEEAWLECKRLISEEIVENIFRKYNLSLKEGSGIVEYLRANLNSFVKF